MKNFLKIWNYEIRLFDTRFLVFIPLGILIFFSISIYLIIIYFFFQKDIIFSAAGWFPIFETIHWYYIFLGLITLQMLIVFLTYRFTKYMKTFSFGTEKQKIIALYLLIGVNLLTIPMNFPLIWSFFAYRKGSEILSNNWFFGTLRRILNEKEKADLYQETVKNFLEKTEASNEVKEQLKNWAFENTKSFLKKYEDGSSFATKFVSEQLEIQKEFLQLEAVKKLDPVIKISDCVDNTDKTQQGWFPWIYDQTMKWLNYLNPFVTDYETCTLAWLFVILSIAIIIYANSSNPGNIPPNSGNISALDEEIMVDLKNQFANIDAILELLFESKNIGPNTPELILLSNEMIEAKKEIKSLCMRIADSRGIIPPNSPVTLSPEKKAEILQNIFQDSEGSLSPATNMAMQMVQDLITNF